MRIQTAFCNVDDIHQLIDAGADELYCGLMVDGENRLYNHRPSVSSMNLNFSELQESIDIIHARGKELFVIVNEVGYSDKIIPGILERIDEMNDMGVDGFIIADLGLLNKLKNKKLKIILSSVAPVFNIEAIDFYRQFGIKRVILPQQLFPSEFKEMKDDLDIETEIFFFKANYCRYIDGFCKYHMPNIKEQKRSSRLMSFENAQEVIASIISRMRGDYYYDKGGMRRILEPCKHTMSVRLYDDSKESKYRSIRLMLDYQFSRWNNPFGAVYDFHRSGIDVIKLGNRFYPLKMKEDIVMFTRYMISLLENEDISRERFISLSSRRWKKVR